jgi:hypothetical protein
VVRLGAGEMAQWLESGGGSWRDSSVVRVSRAGETAQWLECRGLERLLSG